MLISKNLNQVPKSQKSKTQRYSSKTKLIFKRKKEKKKKPKSKMKSSRGLPSKYMKTPSFRRQGLRWRTMTAGRTFLRKSGLPFLTVAMTMSPTQAEGNRLRRPLMPFTEMMYRFFAPVLSAQFTVAATGRPSDILNLLPADPPLPVKQQ